MSSPCSHIDLPHAVIAVDQVEAHAVDWLEDWLAQGRNAGMDYMRNHGELRRWPQLLLPGAKSMVIVAFPYRTDIPVKLKIAQYARGEDYHKWVRRMLKAYARQIGGEWRVCVDSAPLRERYWAQRAGLGTVGLNNQIAVHPYGTYVFLGTILTTVELPAYAPAEQPAACSECQRCVRACPGQCLDAEGTALDARRCLSYLTIESREPLPDGLENRFGCDICQEVCPRNAGALPSPLPQARPSDHLQRLDRLCPDDPLLQGSPICRRWRRAAT